MPAKNQSVRSSRRTFLKQSGILASGLALTSAVPKVHAAENNTINVALVGCGGRGGGAIVQAMNTEGPKKLVAAADVFPERANRLLTDLKKMFSNDVSPNAGTLTGLDAYKHAIDAVGPGGVILLCTPPAFRPMHVEYAVEKGVNIFMEKSFAVDAPGVRRILKAGEHAKQKNLKVVGGLMSRHNIPLQQAVEQIHNGIIGDVITCWAYREHDPVGFGPRSEGESIVAHQIRNYNNFTWLNGSFLLDWLIHNLDVSCWAKGSFPVSAQGQGGRQVRKDKDQLFDHYAVEYTFGDGTRLFAQGRHQENTWRCWQVTVHGTTGCAVIGEGVSAYRIYKGHNPDTANLIWEYRGGATRDQYQVEHDVLFDRIRKDEPINETERCAKTTMVGIMGRMAAETGKSITWDAAMNSDVELAPDLDKLTLDGPAPVMPDENGDYPIAMPGITGF
ncbi:MAG: twin-arginine translocation signal domain-containing protein [Planctomycetaceae bacterium]|jgi:predicted dehydrogenase|nr:twin-arginine translocation signal domain-containing protein [Planctomycetaceae bacterium]